MIISETAAKGPTYGSLEKHEVKGALIVSERGEAPQAARLGRLAVPPLVTGGGDVFVPFALPRALTDRPVAACDVSVAHVWRWLQLQKEH